MNLDTLRFYCGVVSSRSFSQAARHHDVTQSNISQAVQHVERELGVQLIDRSRRPLVPTREGKLLYTGLRNILQKYDNLMEAVSLGKLDRDAVVSISVIYSVGINIMNKFITRFSGENPQVQVRLEYQHPDLVYKHVLNGEADIGIISFPEDDRQFQITPWQMEKMVVVTAVYHELAGKTSVAVRNLNGYNLVAFDPGLHIRSKIDAFLEEQNAKLPVVLEFDNIESIKRAVETDMGIAILPLPTVLKELKAGSLSSVEFSDAELYRPLGIIQRVNQNFEPWVEDFTVLLKAGAE